MTQILPKIDDRIIEDSATALIGGKDVFALAALHDMSDDEFGTLLEANVVQIDKRIAAMESDGRAIRIKSRAVLAKALHQIGDAVENNQIAPGQLTRVVEVLHKTSGLEAELRREELDTAPKFSLIIHLDGKSLCYGEAAKEANVLDGEAIDVTPVEKVRDDE